MPPTRITTIYSERGFPTEIFHEPQGMFSGLAQESAVDAIIVATEDGYSTLGANPQFLAADLGVPEEEIQDLARWNRFENPQVTLVTFASRRQGGLLRERSK